MAGLEGAERTLSLFDTYWFHNLILLPPPPPPPPPSPEPTAASAPPPPGPAPPDLRHCRSSSDEAAAAASRDQETLKIPSPANLETILSCMEEDPAAGRPDPRRQRRRSGLRRRPRGRSISELEVEEMKGLRDLGFTFSDAEMDTELASIVPGLRRRRSEAIDGPAARPYLSEAWEAMGEEEDATRGMLRNWRIPEDGEGADLKENLRLWAHTVASAVQ